MGYTEPANVRSGLNNDSAPSIFVVDDDKAVRDALALLLKIEGFAPRCFSDGGTFLEVARIVTPACVILDLHLPGQTPLSVLQQLSAAKFRAPVLVISGQTDIALAIETMKHGALDYLEKPFPAAVLVARVRAALSNWAQTQHPGTNGVMNFAGGDMLTQRERDVLNEVVCGWSNKEAGRRLHISPRTVEVHRARIMGKLGARNTADLMRIVLSETPTRSAPSRAISDSGEGRDGKA